MFQLNKLKRQGSFRALSSYFGAIVQGTTVWTRDNRFIVVLSVGHRWLHHTHFPLACLVEGLNVVSCGQKHVNKWHISESISCLIYHNITICKVISYTSCLNDPPPPGKEKYIVSYLCYDFPKYIRSLFFRDLSAIVENSSFFLKIKI